MIFLSKLRLLIDTNLSNTSSTEL